MNSWKVSGNTTGLGLELKKELQRGSRGMEYMKEKLWEREFGKSDMSPKLGKDILDIPKGRRAVQWPNGSEWKNEKNTGVSYARSNP